MTAKQLAKDIHSDIQRWRKIGWSDADILASLENVIEQESRRVTKR